MVLPKKTGDTPTWQRGSNSGGTPIAEQLMENPIYNWMMARGTLYFKKPPNRKHTDDKVIINRLLHVIISHTSGWNGVPNFLRTTSCDKTYLFSSGMSQPGMFDDTSQANSRKITDEFSTPKHYFHIYQSSYSVVNQ